MILLVFSAMLRQFVYVLCLLCLLHEGYCQYSSKDGPRFFVQPKDTYIIETGLPNVTIDCFAVGVPQPTYEWIKLTTDNQSLSLNNTPRYAFNFGYLIIENPTQEDEGTYQCKASDIYGTILSTAAQLKILELGEFSEVLPAPTHSLEFDGAAIQCPYFYFNYRNPVLSYRWYKDDLSNWINPDENRTFISANRNLFISETSRSDEGKYYCQITMSTFLLDGNIIGKNELSKTSLPVDFKVHSSDPSTRRLSIVPPGEFLYVQPSTPLKGSCMRVECFAYGPGALHYTWSREDNKPMPASSRFESNNRVLIVDNVGLDDGGLYTCDIYSTTSQQSYLRSKFIAIEARPYFTIELTSPQLEPGSRLIWYCEADGIPAPTYTWYKNGVELKSSSRVTVNMKTLTIYSVNGSEDNGMYQCEARNKHGSVYSTAQLQISDDYGCIGCSRSDTNYGSWESLSMMLTMTC